MPLTARRRRVSVRDARLFPHFLPLRCSHERLTDSSVRLSCFHERLTDSPVGLPCFHERLTNSSVRLPLSGKRMKGWKGEVAPFCEVLPAPFVSVCVPHTCISRQKAKLTTAVFELSVSSIPIQLGRGLKRRQQFLFEYPSIPICLGRGSKRRQQFC